MYSYGPPHMAVQKQEDQHEHTFSNYVRIRDVVLRTCLGRWTIGRSGERGSGIAVLPARHDDDIVYIKCEMFLCVFTQPLCHEQDVTQGFLLTKSRFEFCNDGGKLIWLICKSVSESLSRRITWESSISNCASCGGFSADCLASVPDMADMRPKSPRVRLDHFQVGKLQLWHPCLPCIAVDLAVQFKL